MVYVIGQTLFYTISDVRQPGYFEAFIEIFIEKRPKQALPYIFHFFSGINSLLTWVVLLIHKSKHS